MQAIPPEHANAIERFESYLGGDPENTQILMTLGDLYHRAGRMDDASRCYGRVLELDGTDRIARSRLAGVALSRRDFGSAEVMLRELIDAGEDDPALHHNLGIALVHQGRWEDALAMLEHAASAGAPLPRNLAYQAHAHHHLGNLERARELAEAWTRAESTTDAHGYLSLVEMDLGAVAEARRRASAVLASDPENDDAGVVVGTSLLEQQEIERAADLFAGMVGRAPDNPRAWLGLGLVHLYRRRFDEAIRSLERALALMPRNGGTRVTLGWTHILNRDIDRAERVFREAIDVNRNFGEAHGGFAAVLALRGNVPEARAAIRRAHGLDRGGFGAAFAHAVLLEQEGKHDLATRLVEKTLSRQLRDDAPSLFEAIQTFAHREAARGMTGPAPRVQ